MTTEQLDKLKELAERVKDAGKLEVVFSGSAENALSAVLHNNNRSVVVHVDLRREYRDPGPLANYIAALSPDVVLSLIAEVKELRQLAADHLRGVIGGAVTFPEIDRIKKYALNSGLALRDFQEDSPYPENESLRSQLAEAREVIYHCANPEGIEHTNSLFEIKADCSDGDYYRTIIGQARAYLEKYK